MRDHGGDLDRAIKTYGDGDWLDLSTGINARPYPVGDVPREAWAALPTRTDMAALEALAAGHYGTNGQVVALAGAQGAIQLVPRLRSPGRACVVGPTYNEHAAALRAQGWQVETVSEPEEGIGADLLTLVSPNNPDGRRWGPEALLRLRDQVGLLVVDESFADTEEGVSVAPQVGLDEESMIILRSFGKFYGLAGLRLGFAITGAGLARDLRALTGPWAVSGPAIVIGRRALGDAEWQAAARLGLAQDAARLDALAAQSGWRLVGGTALFRTYETSDAMQTQNQLAQHHIWTRIFPYSPSWLRLGLPGSDAGWGQLEQAMPRQT